MSYTVTWAHGMSFESVEYAFPLYSLNDVPIAGNGYWKRGVIGSVFSPREAGEIAFEVAIPGPSLLEDYSLQLRSARLLFSSNDATISSIGLWDGEAEVGTFETSAGLEIIRHLMAEISHMSILHILFPAHSRRW